MRVFIYQAALYCEDCGNHIRKVCALAGMAKHINPDDESSYDSGEYPKGSYQPDESDSPQHCDSCGVFLENPLTDDGIAFVRSALKDQAAGLVCNDAALAIWRDYYASELAETLPG